MQDRTYLDSTDAVFGYRHNVESAFVVLSTDTKREFVASLETGISVRGIVRDAKSQGPIKGATVAPIMDMHQAFWPNTERAVTTDAEGRFAVHGVNPNWGAKVSHPEYQSHHISCKDQKARSGAEQLIDLQVGEKQLVRGIIRDDEGRGVSSVTISGWQQTTSSQQDGRFTLIIPPPDYTSSEIHFKKPGYGDEQIHIELPVVNELAVVLVPRFVVEGTVRSSQGQPLPSFTIAVGPKLEPDHWDCVSQDVHDPTGHFSVAVKDAGSNRVVVKAEGHAVWEGASRWPGSPRRWRSSSSRVSSSPAESRGRLVLCADSRPR